MERIFDSPRRVRFVAANVAASDTVKGSHIQRNPLSMGALAEPEEWPRVSQSPKEKKRRDCVMTARLTLSGMQQRKLAHSCEVGSYVPPAPRADGPDRGDRGALEAFVLWLTNIRVCAGELGAFDAHLCVGSERAREEYIYFSDIRKNL